MVSNIRRSVRHNTCDNSSFGKYFLLNTCSTSTAAWRRLRVIRPGGTTSYHYFVRALSLRVFSAPASRQSSGLFHVHMAQSTRMCAGLRCNSMGSRAVGRSLGRAQVAKKTHAFIATSAAPLRVTCMANQRRVAKVQQQMRREISNMMQTDKVSPGKSWPGRLLRRWRASSIKP